MKLAILFLVSLNVFAISDKEYISNVSKTLKKNPNNINLIVEAGKRFYEKKDCKNAIWYFSSPVLKKSKRYIAYRYLQATCHYILKEYADAEFVILLVRQEKLPPKFSKMVEQLAKKIRVKTAPPAPEGKVNINGHYGMLSFSSDAEKESASIKGASLILDEFGSKFEIAAEKLDMKFNSSLGFEDYSQTDIVLGYSFFDDNFYHNNQFLIHTNSVSSNFAISATSLMYAYDYYFAPFEKIGLELSYNKFKSESEINSFSSTQVAPVLTFGLWKYFYITLKGYASTNNYAGSSTTDVAKLEKSYSSFEGTIGLYITNLVLSYTQSVGEEKFLLKSKGMLIQNSTDSNKSSSNISGKYTFSKNFSLTGLYSSGTYSEENSDINYNSSGVIVFGTLSF
jgi:hypothetical protein